MEKPAKKQNGKSPKNPKSKRNYTIDVPKVVYIPSPVKVETSVSDFRTLVQELTGQDSKRHVLVFGESQTTRNNNVDLSSSKGTRSGSELFVSEKNVCSPISTDGRQFKKGKKKGNVGTVEELNVYDVPSFEADPLVRSDSGTGDDELFVNVDDHEYQIIFDDIRSV